MGQGKQVCHFVPRQQAVTPHTSAQETIEIEPVAYRRLPVQPTAFWGLGAQKSPVTYKDYRAVIK